MAAHVLVVDDDLAERRHIEDILRDQGHSAESAGSGGEALARLAKTDAPLISAVILDLVMPDLDGMAVLERLSRYPHPVPVIVQAAPGGADAGAAAMRAGALDYLVKPAAPGRVRVSLANALRIGALESEILRMRRSQSGTLGLRNIVMHSPSMERVNRLGERAARSSIPVLVEGERGVGKELLARAIHGSGARRSRPFVALSCRDMQESELALVLFGEPEKDELAGAKAVEANGGTLFLEEISALPSALQERLARALAKQEANAPAAGRSQRGDVRLIAATSHRLIDLVSDDGFNEALFYRLNIFPIWLPPLRERRADIPDLARGLLARLAAEAGRSFITGISTAAMEQLIAHAWPGNIRELEHAIFRAIMLCEDGELSPRDFPSITARGQPADSSFGLSDNGLQLLEQSAGVAVQKQVTGERPPASEPFADMRTTARYGVARLLDDRGELRPIEVLEEEVIRFAIDHYSGRMSEVARRLGIGRSTLYRKIRDYGIASSEPVAS
jgi:DNA-binding NtrC family response regulator